MDRGVTPNSGKGDEQGINCIAGKSAKTMETVSIPRTVDFPLRRMPGWIAGIEWIAITGFSLGLVLSKALANIALGLMVIPFARNLIHYYPRWRRDPLLAICGIWIAYVGVLGIAQIYVHDLPFVPPFIEVFGFAFIPLFAMALQGRWERIRVCLLLALVGLLVKILLDGHWTGPGPLYDYARSNKALGVNRNNVAPLIDTGVLGVLLLLQERLRVLKTHWHYAALGFIAWALGVLLYVWATLSSRASWVALVLGILIAGYCLSGARQVRRFALILPLLMVIVALFFGSAMSERMVSESETWLALFTGHWDKVPFSSVGIRYRLAHIGIHYFLQHPLTGWGPAVKQLIASNSLYPEVSESVQFHNGMLELLVRTGVIGLLIYIAAAATIYRAAKQLPMLHEHGLAVFAGLLGVFVIVIVNNFSISFIYFQHGWQLIVFAGGIAYGHLYSLPAEPNHMEAIDQNDADQKWRSDTD